MGRRLKVGKTFLFYWNGDHGCPVFKLGFDERDFLIEVDPETFFTTDHRRNWPSVLGVQAPKKILKAYDPGINQ